MWPPVSFNPAGSCHVDADGGTQRARQTPPATYRNLAIEELADSEAALRAQLANLESERNVYREMVSLLLTAQHDLEGRFRRQQGRVQQLLDDLREARATKAAMKRAA